MNPTKLEATWCCFACICLTPGVFAKLLNFLGNVPNCQKVPELGFAQVGCGWEKNPNIGGAKMVNAPSAPVIPCVMLGVLGSRLTPQPKFPRLKRRVPKSA